MPSNSAFAIDLVMQSGATGNGAGTVFPTGGLTTLSAEIDSVAGFSATINWEAEVDGTWVAINATNVTTLAAAATAAAAGLFLINCGEYDQVRARISSYVSGTITVTAKGGMAGPAVQLVAFQSTGTLGLVNQGSAASSVAGAWFVQVTDLTHTMPTMDAVGRAGYQYITDGTHTQPAADAVARGLFAQTCDGTNQFKSGSAANLSATSAVNAQMTCLAGQWIVTSAPGSGTTASASQSAAGSGIRNVCNAISAKLSGDSTGAAFAGTLNLRNGATGAGSVLATWLIALPSGAYAIGQSIDLSGLNVPGSANTAMTLEFTGNTAHALQSCTLIGTTCA